jgi:alkylhydroperoxidase family enzyme
MRTLTWIGAGLLGLVMAGPLGAQEKPPVEQQKVSRLPPLPQPLDPVLQDMFAKRRAQGGAVINLQLTTGHSPKFSQAASTMAFAIRFDSEVPRRLIELTIMRTAQIVDSKYEINQHIPLFKMCDFTDAQLAALPAWKTSALFDAKERGARLCRADGPWRRRRRSDLRRIAEIFLAEIDRGAHLYGRQLLRQWPAHQGVAHPD